MKKKSSFDFLRRKHIGKSKIEHYVQIMSRFGQYNLISLEKSDLIIDELSSIAYPKQKNELIQKNLMTSFENSSILNDIYKELLPFSECYVFTDDYLYCGLCLTDAKEAITECFKIAKEDDSNTCFLVSTDFLFYVRINYYDEMHNDYPNCFEINAKEFQNNLLCTNNR